MSSATPHRIDPPSTSSSRVGGPHIGHQRSPQVSVGHGPDDDAPEFGPRVDLPQSTPSGLSALLPTPEEWLQLHATELVQRLQAWSSELDAREAQMNARCSIQDHRERQFRLRQQDAETELAEQQRAIERLRNEIEAQARRLAFGGQEEA